MKEGKKGNRYFSHDSDAFLDSRIVKMRARLGIAGYGAYWVVIERLRTSEDYMHETDYDVLAFVANSDPELFRSLIEDFELFEFTEQNGKTYFYSESLRRRMAKMEDIMDKRRAAGRKGAEARWQKDDTPTAEPQEEDGKRMTNAWQTHSTPNAVPMAKNGKRKEKKRKETKLSTEVKDNTEKSSSSEGIPHMAMNGPQGQPEGRPAEYPEKDHEEKDRLAKGFERFWQVYPRKVKKQRAESAWQKIKKDLTDELIEKIIQAVKDQDAALWQGKDPQYTPHPSSWLNDKRWNDEIPKNRGNGNARPEYKNGQRVIGDNRYFLPPEKQKELDQELTEEERVFIEAFDEWLLPQIKAEEERLGREMEYMEGMLLRSQKYDEFEALQKGAKQ